MWRRTYLFLVVLRLYLALSPSYIHPDEHFQGPEVIAGRVFGYASHLTWEFTSDSPIRSVFPLQIFYGLPLTLLKWICDGIGYHNISPATVYYTLRALMFVLSFVLEDWALDELIHVPKERRVAQMLVASSYVTWTFQNHTFSNSVETLIVLWCLVLINRIKEDKSHTRVLPSALLAFLCVLGTFNRITFPPFVLIPLLQLIPHFRHRPLSLLVMILTAAATLLFAVVTDTEWFLQQRVHLSQLRRIAIITPLNNFLYNMDSSNLAKHGLHPYYQHVVANLPQLLGPALPLVFFSCRMGMPMYSAGFGILALSCLKHQEARFLLPAVPLILSSISVPRRMRNTWITVWIIFNVCLGLLMGVFHQGGVVPAQLWVGKQQGVQQAFWWKTYSPPTYLLGQNHQGLVTRDLMGMHGDKLIEELKSKVDCDAESTTLLLAPLSATFLDAYITQDSTSSETSEIALEEVWRYRNHLNLDDMDFGDDGVWPTLKRMVGRRGIGAWKVTKKC
ncbi:GPI mannosyltransferase 4, partial [Aureobasidium melanogenum]